MELQIWEIWNKIQQIFRREIELLGVDRNMRERILEVKSRRTRVFINGMFIYYFVNPGGWGNLRKRRGKRKRGHWFWNGRLRHFHTFALVVEKISYINCLLFMFFWWQKKNSFWNLYWPVYLSLLLLKSFDSPSSSESRKIHTKAAVDVSKGGGILEVGLLGGKWTNWEKGLLGGIRGYVPRNYGLMKLI